MHNHHAYTIDQKQVKGRGTHVPPPPLLAKPNWHIFDIARLIEHFLETMPLQNPVAAPEWNPHLLHMFTLMDKHNACHLFIHLKWRHPSNKKTSKCLGDGSRIIGLIGNWLDFSLLDILLSMWEVKRSKEQLFSKIEMWNTDKRCRSASLNSYPFWWSGKGIAKSLAFRWNNSEIKCWH